MPSGTMDTCFMAMQCSWLEINTRLFLFESPTLSQCGAFCFTGKPYSRFPYIVYQNTITMKIFAFLSFSFLLLFISCQSAAPKLENLGKAGPIELKRQRIAIPLDEQSLPTYQVFAHFERNQRSMFYGYNPNTKQLDIFNLNTQLIEAHLPLDKIIDASDLQVEQVFVFRETDIFLFGNGQLLRINRQGELQEHHSLQSSWNDAGLQGKPTLSANFGLEYLPEQDSVLFYCQYPLEELNPSLSVIAKYKLGARAWELMPIKHLDEVAESGKLAGHMVELVKGNQFDNENIWFGYLYESAISKFNLAGQSIQMKAPRNDGGRFIQLPSETENANLLLAHFMLNPQYFKPLSHRDSSFIFRPYWKVIDIDEIQEKQLTDKRLYISIFNEEGNYLSEFPMEPYRYGINKWFAGSKGLYILADHPRSFSSNVQFLNIDLLRAAL